MKYSPQRPNAAKPQPKQQALFHHRGTEFAEFGVFLNQKRFSPRLGGAIPTPASHGSLKTQKIGPLSILASTERLFNVRARVRPVDRVRLVWLQIKQEE